LDGVPGRVCYNHGAPNGAFPDLHATGNRDQSARLISLTPLGLTVSNPPTQAEVQALADKLEELINTLSA
jgi:hypothetical protein